MRTLFVVAMSNVVDHENEEYDFIIQVPDEPTTDNIGEFADRIRGRIRALNEEQLADKEENPVVSVNLAAASPFNAMLINLKILMADEENVTVSLDYPHEEEGRTIDDPEAQALIDKLDNNG
jgi:hypothetical protein